MPVPHLTPTLDERQAVARALQVLRGERPQAVVAARAGIAQARWSSYEGGKHRPTVTQRIALAHGLEVPLLELEQEIFQTWREQILHHRPEPPATLLRLALKAAIHELESLQTWMEQGSPVSGASR